MKMRCEDIQSVLIDFLDDRMDAIRRQELVTHLEVCENCRQEESQLRELLRAVAETPEEQPPGTLRENFKRMMQTPPATSGVAETSRNSAETPVKKLPLHLPAIGWNSPVSRVAVAILLLLTGFGIGLKTANNRDGATPTQMAELKSEVRDVKQTLMLSMLKQESASDRIKAVDYAEEIVNPNQQILGALITTLNHDKNVNVRLASLYSLSKFAGNRTVLDSLVVSLNQQTEPIIQIVMISILTQNRAAGAIKPLQDIISNQNTLPAVKDVARKGLQTL
jgi:Putative zinc-finger